MSKYINIALVVALVCTVFALIYVGCKRQNAALAINTGVVDATKAYHTKVIDSLVVANKQLDSTVAVYQKKINSLRFDYKLINDKYKLLLDEISDTPDSAQLAITRRLLARYKDYQ